MQVGEVAEHYILTSHSAIGQALPSALSGAEISRTLRICNPIRWHIYITTLGWFLSHANRSLIARVVRLPGSPLILHIQFFGACCPLRNRAQREVKAHSRSLQINHHDATICPVDISSACNA